MERELSLIEVVEEILILQKRVVIWLLLEKTLLLNAIVLVLRWMVLMVLVQFT